MVTDKNPRLSLTKSTLSERMERENLAVGNLKVTSTVIQKADATPK
jgi:hypothetical protein